MTDPARSVGDTAERYDLVVIGGGITGAGIARDAALRGLKVALFEKGDFASGTSSKSSKLIHGGLRYLEHGQIGLVFESVSERSVQRALAPHLVRPLPFLVPVYEGARHGLETLNLGLWLYELLALFRAPKLHRTFRGARARDFEPALRAQALRGIIEYHDCMTDDFRLTLENILDASALGADCHSYTAACAIERDAAGLVERVRVRDVASQREWQVQTSAVIVAAGAWTDETSRRLGLADVGARALLRRTKGVHAVFTADKLSLRHAVTMISPIDGRVMFVIPWRDRLYIGTTDTDFAGSADEVVADAADIRYLCESANYYFPEVGFRPEDVIATWAGLRPLINDQEVEDESAVSREHDIIGRDDGVFIIAGGKLTTYRLMAEEAVNRAVGWLKAHRGETIERRSVAASQTKKRALPGAVGLTQKASSAIAELTAELSRQGGLDPDIATHLAFTYGTRAEILLAAILDDRALGARMQDDLPYVWAEVAFAIEHDRAQTIDDVLSRRIPLLLIGREQGLDILDRTSDLAAARLGWDEPRRERERAAYRRVVADTRRFRADGEVAAAAP
ncbi:MAG: glycerol-3-phosphate dehydrogenase/oxidase [Haliangiales bacterium]